LRVSTGECIGAHTSVGTVAATIDRIMPTLAIIDRIMGMAIIDRIITVDIITTEISRPVGIFFACSLFRVGIGVRIKMANPLTVIVREPTRRLRVGV
jgi:hypothetical protein